MKILQNKFVRSLPIVILFAITFYNFAWVYWQSLDPMAGRGIAPVWYKSTKDFPLAQFLLVIASYSFFIKNRWSCFAGFLISGYYVAAWYLLLIWWFINGEHTFYGAAEIIASSYRDNNPLTCWESQPTIATTIFSVATYSLIKELTTSQPKKLL
jgi:hypothetical protein